MKLLIKFPTRGRPARFLETLRLYSSMMSGKHSVIFLVIIDSDDETMQAPDVRKAMNSIPNVVVSVGEHTSKIGAINDDTVSKFMDWDVLLLASDDMIPQVNGYDDIICSKMEECFHGTDGVLWFNDGYTSNRLDTLCILGKVYYERFGYIYHPEYSSLWCDNEFMDVFKLNGRYKYFPECIIKHQHWANDQSVKKDERYQISEGYYDQDKEVYERHKALGFGVKIWSILICTVPNRACFFDPLLAKLKKQVLDAGAEGLVEVLYEVDSGAMMIGDKRNILLDRASGEYISYVDDDDYVSDDYVKLLFAAMMERPDCVGIVGEVFMGNLQYKPFIHSIAYSAQGEAKEFFFRPPNHLNPIRRTIAMKHRFPSLDRSEDTEYSLSIVESGDLKTQIMVDTPVYFYIPSWMRVRGKVKGIEKPCAEPIS